jgi:hypothetical protein
MTRDHRWGARHNKHAERTSEESNTKGQQVAAKRRDTTTSN